MKVHTYTLELIKYYREWRGVQKKKRMKRKNTKIETLLLIRTEQITQSMIYMCTNGYNRNKLSI